jgi:hypothetical protein
MYARQYAQKPSVLVPCFVQYAQKNLDGVYTIKKSKKDFKNLLQVAFFGVTICLSVDRQTVSTVSCNG